MTRTDSPCALAFVRVVVRRHACHATRPQVEPIAALPTVCFPLLPRLICTRRPGRCRGTLDAIKFLAAEARAAPRGAEPPSVLFLTPCHAAPLYSHLHAPLAAHFLDCSPLGWGPAVARLNNGGPLWPRRQVSNATAAGTPPVTHSSQAAGFCEASQATDQNIGQCGTLDIRRGSCVGEDGTAPGVVATPARAQEAEGLAEAAAAGADTVMHPAVLRNERQLFEASPSAWLQLRYPPAGCKGPALPTYVVVFDNQLAAVSSWLPDRGYRLSRNFFHTHFAVDDGHEARVLVFTLHNVA